MKNEIGVLAGLGSEGYSPEYVAGFGLKVCQLLCWEQELFVDELGERVKKQSEDAGVTITSLWAGWPGPAVWDFVEGPVTLGLVPEEHRAGRMAALKSAGRFAQKAGIPAVVTHLGFIPENPKTRLFDEMVCAVGELADYFKEKDLEFWFETGQETPVTMLRLIECVGTGNLGINLDPANLILYGKASPVDSLDVFGAHVRSVHAKDGLYPVDPMKLGREVKVGEGRVRFPEFVKRLAEIGYEGAYIIEREISGEEQDSDIRDTVEYLRSLVGGVDND
jgi:sugar phosphate isomerase/epimerase